MIMGWASIIVWAVGTVSIVKGFREGNIELLAMGAILWSIMNFIEILILRDRIKHLKGESNEDNEDRESK